MEELDAGRLGANKRRSTMLVLATRGHARNSLAVNVEDKPKLVVCVAARLKHKRVAWEHELVEDLDFRCSVDLLKNAQHVWIHEVWVAR